MGPHLTPGVPTEPLPHTTPYNTSVLMTNAMKGFTHQPPTLRTVMHPVLAQDIDYEDNKRSNRKESSINIHGFS